MMSALCHRTAFGPIPPRQLMPTLGIWSNTINRHKPTPGIWCNTMPGIWSNTISAGPEGRHLVHLMPTPEIWSNTTTSAYANYPAFGPITKGDAQHLVHYHNASLCQRPAFDPTIPRRHKPTPGIWTNTMTSACANTQYLVQYHVT